MKKIVINMSVHSPGKAGKKKMNEFTDDLASVIEKHFPDSGWTICGGPKVIGEDDA